MDEEDYPIVKGGLNPLVSSTGFVFKEVGRVGTVYGPLTAIQAVRTCPNSS